MDTERSKDRRLFECSTAFFPLPDRPTDCIDGHSTIAKVCDTNMQMFFWRRSISTYYKSEPGGHLELDTLTSSGKMERHQDGSECGKACHPCAYSVPDLDLLIECHSARPEIANYK